MRLLLLGLISVAGLLTVMWWLQGPEPIEAVVPAREQEQNESTPHVAPAPSSDRSARSASPKEPESSSDPPVRTEERESRLNSILVDAHGDPLPDVVVVLTLERWGMVMRRDVVTDENGRFKLAPQLDVGGLQSDLYGLLGTAVRIEDQGELRVFIAGELRTVAGVVQDEAGVVEGAEVEIWPRLHSLQAVTGLLSVNEVTKRTTSGPDGSFSLRVPDLPQGLVSAHAIGRMSTSVPVTPGNCLGLVLELRTRATEELVLLSGRVLDIDGRPVPEATVLLGQVRQWTDDEGLYELEFRSWDLEVGRSLMAVKEGVGTTLVEDYWLLHNPRQESASGIDLVLDPGLAIHGRVVDHRGEPLEGWHVNLVDGTPLGTVNRTLENPAPWGASDTDEDGAFELVHLGDRDYRLRAWNDSALKIRSAPIPAGSRGVVIVVPEDAAVEQVEGVVLSPWGDPIANATVRVTTDVHRTETSSYSHFGPLVTTDEQGRFTIGPVSRRYAWLVVDGSEVEHEKFAVEELEDPTSAVLTASRRVRFRVEGGVVGDKVRFLDENGESMAVRVMRANSIVGFTDVPAGDAGFPVIQVPDVARSLVHLRDGEVLRELDLPEAPSGLVTIDL